MKAIGELACFAVSLRWYDPGQVRRVCSQAGVSSPTTPNDASARADLGTIRRESLGAQGGPAGYEGVTGFGTGGGSSRAGVSDSQPHSLWLESQNGLSLD